MLKVKTLTLFLSAAFVVVFYHLGAEEQGVNTKLTY